MVTPKKRMTIPRVELYAACMAVKLALTFVEVLDYCIDMVTFWIFHGRVTLDLSTEQ